MGPGPSVTTFSIFLPVRNGWPYVQDCVESILGQTYPHFELNILDNQSTDNTMPWLKTLTDNRIRLWSSTSSLSIEDSWARVKDLSKREFMTLIGHDDTLDASFLATTKALIDRHPDANLYQTGSRLINSDGKTIRACRAAPQRETAAEYLSARLTFQRDIFGTGYVIRSADYDRLGGIPGFEKLFFADDALWLSLLHGSYKASDPGQHFSVRIHPKSESASLPSAWSSILLGLNQFTDFLRHYVKDDEASRSVVDRLEPEFLLAYHRNIYIYALVEACQSRMKLDPVVLERIESSLKTSTSMDVSHLHRSAKVALIEFLNMSPLRAQVPRLWNAYYKLKTKSR
jgi:glycosyltransferase involved in cell wall biosynthesis